MDAVSHPRTTPRLTVATVALLLILALALVLRFRYLAYIEHNVDHAYPVWQALTTLDQGALPLAGQGTSVLFANPPLTGYLYLPAVALTRSPLGVYVFVIALNTLGVYLTYRAARTLIGPGPALIAAALLAVNPWMIEYSRTSWVQSLLPFFVPAVAWLLWPVLRGTARRPLRNTVLALVMAALLAHTYLLAFFITAPVGLLVLIYWRRVPRRGLVMGGAVFAVMFALYAVGLLGQLDDVQARLDNFTSGESRLSLDAWDAAARLVTGAEYELARGLDAPTGDWERRHSFTQPVQNFLQAMLLLGMIGAALAVIRGGPRRDSGVIALVWFGLPILAMSYTGSPVHPFYQIMGAPAGYALAAWGISLLLPPQTRPGAVIAALLFVPFALLMSVNSARYYQETAALPGAHGLNALPVGAGMQMGEAVRAAIAADSTGDALAFAPTEGWIINSFAGELFPVWREPAAPDFVLIPRTGGAYVAIGDAPAVPAGSGQVTRLALPDSTLLVAELRPARAFDALIDAPDLHFTDVPSQQGITLIGYRVAPAEATSSWRVTLLYRVDDVTPDALDHLYQPFVHAYTGAERAANVSGAAFPGPLWRVGDLHRYEIVFTLPPGTGAFRVETGLFDGVDGANVIFLTEDAPPAVAVPLPIIDETAADNRAGDATAATFP